MARTSTPLHSNPGGSTLAENTFDVAGIAFAAAGVDRVQVSLDGGVTWQYCDQGADLSGGGCAGVGSADGYTATAAGDLTVR